MSETISALKSRTFVRPETEMWIVGVKLISAIREEGGGRGTADSRSIEVTVLVLEYQSVGPS
jgi:hypothetical protein